MDFRSGRFLFVERDYFEDSLGADFGMGKYALYHHQMWKFETTGATRTSNLGVFSEFLIESDCEKTKVHDDVIKSKRFYALLFLCVGNSPLTDEFPAQRPVTRSFDVFFDLHLNKRLSKQSWGYTCIDYHVYMYT